MAVVERGVGCEADELSDSSKLMQGDLWNRYSESDDLMGLEAVAAKKALGFREVEDGEVWNSIGE